jgi:hypothetical protein
MQFVRMLVFRREFAQMQRNGSHMVKGHALSGGKAGGLHAHEWSAWCLGDARMVSHLVLRPKSDAHHMYAQDEVVIHTTRM